MDAPKFGPMYAASFQNTLANDLWEGRDYYPKRAMLKFIERDPDLIRSMFKELYNENLDIEGRIDRFLFHLESMREDWNRMHNAYEKHYHDNYRMISTYLAFRYPTEYAICDYDAWRRFITLTGGREVEGDHEIGRFFKSMRALNKVLQKDADFWELINGYIQQQPGVYKGETLLVATEFCEFVGRQP